MSGDVSSDRLAVLVNRHGGAAGRLGERLGPSLEAAFAAAGLGADIHLLTGSEVRNAVRAHRDAPLVVVAGGDGTLGCAADELAGSGAALGILPLGTRNHLAGALGLPSSLTEAAALFADPVVRVIDVARVNGRVFVNNASIGLYPAVVEGRDAARERHGLPKWVAAIPASIAALRRLRHHRLRLRYEGSAETVVTPLLFVGNNDYSLEARHIGERAALDAGTMSVLAVASRRRLALIGFALRTLAGRIDRDEDFAVLTETAALTVEGASHHVRIALDGEVMRLAMPLRFESRPGALRVVAPLSASAASPKSTA